MPGPTRIPRAMYVVGRCFAEITSLLLVHLLVIRLYQTPLSLVHFIIFPIPLFFTPTAQVTQTCFPSLYAFLFFDDKSIASSLCFNLFLYGFFNLVRNLSLALYFLMLLFLFSSFHIILALIVPHCYLFFISPILLRMFVLFSEMQFP
jgi:hypothetical protein